MGRLARVLSCDIPFHVTQRGNGRQCVFDSDDDRLVHIDLRRVVPRPAKQLKELGMKKDGAVYTCLSIPTLA